MKQQILALLFLLVPGLAFGQGSIRTMPPVCLAAGLTDGTCVPQRQGTRARITDGDDTNNDCTGGGSTAVTCEYDGSAWIPVTSGTWVGANGESIVNTTDGTFLFTRDESGVVTITGFDGSNPTDVVFDSGGLGFVRVGSADTAAVILLADNDVVRVTNGATGIVSLDLRDYADTTDDDMAHGLITVNCTDTGTGSEDCDFSIGIANGGAAPVTMFNIDGDNGDDGSEPAITIGEAQVELITFTTDNASMTLDATTNELIVTAATTGVAVFRGADAASPASTTFDTTGAGAIILGSADVTTLAITNNGAMTIGAAATTDTLALESAGAITLEATGAINIGDASATSVPIITDGGTVTIDGFVQGQVPVVSQTAGAIVINTVTLVTAAGDYTIADDLCALAADIGNWFTLVIEDDDQLIVINPLDAADVLFIPGVDIAAGDEADSIVTAAYEGAHITMVCMAVNQWYATSVSTEADGSVFWVDGGSS